MDAVKMHHNSTQTLPNIVRQHVEEAAMLRMRRSTVCSRPDVRLEALARLDERLLAHLDGVAVAGEAGRQMALDALEVPGVGEVFVAAVRALQTKDAAVLTKVVELAQLHPEAEQGFLSALGWVSAQDLQGTVRALMGSKVAAHRGWALAACALHGVDPGSMLVQAMQDVDKTVRAAAWRTAAQLGRMDLADAARQFLLSPKGSAPTHDEHATVLMSSAALPEDDPVDRRAAAWALTLWGQGDNDLVRQHLLALSDGAAPCSPEDAHRLAIMACSMDWGRVQIREMGARAETNLPLKRRMVRMAGWLGDVQIVPWLIQHLADDRWARLAGEALTLITGVDLGSPSLVRAQPGQPNAGPTDHPEDVEVAMDEDDHLPWPDQQAVQAWWQANAGQFPSGQRLFLGAAPQRRHLLAVLQNAGQRHRAMAAEHLCLQQPGCALFSVGAPAWRQRRVLTDMERAG